MSEDKQLEELAARMRARKKEDFDASWDDLSAGKLDRQEVDALRQAETEGIAPEGAYDAFRPLSEDFRRELADKAAARLVDESTALPAAEPIPFPGPVASEKPRRNFVPLATAATVMLALGVFFVGLPGGGNVAPIPGYSVMMMGASASRSGPQASEVPMFRAGDRFELRLTPDTAVDGPVEVRLLLDDGDSLRELDSPPAEIAASGAIRIAGTIARSVLLPDGESTLYAVVERHGEGPSERRLRAALKDRSDVAGDGWQAWRLSASFMP